ncbi:cupin domain-containing protein [Edaphobacter albus]|uniref:cupin domain-containing protein n=1 Tax=Edaphobacter sp. 4G125 TaxID=2763071 RepID=UPI0016445255|nr:cupin domain-containing protein [Edaphobacter sp. 4G125]QNI38155.1 cupin domain-containing protein [Edaphobacter sp. 4G125]
MTTSKTDGNMIDSFAQFDLVKEIADSRNKKPWSAGHYAKTLFKKEDFRTVLITMEPNSRMKEHHADGTLSVQVIQGAIRFTAQGKAHELRTGNLVTLGASIPHEVESLEDSAFLLTISWPSNQELLAMKHRGYGT